MRNCLERLKKQLSDQFQQFIRELYGFKLNLQQEYSVYSHIDSMQHQNGVEVSQTYATTQESWDEQYTDIYEHKYNRMRYGMFQSSKLRLDFLVNLYTGSTQQRASDSEYQL
ncbi:hypothetical protein SS50377_26037 [Spironucleus salmonicida]|uniref:Uncharacterized protein n=1 Tax=Spironucleus salmonicida TaxID=348837 RepID=V6LF76_9EUKA|nr:hypothetical protein SS50377_26037 [Spironucleus salmonicida]|eukprot:EST42341.1 Hypothetical protein SS50377_18130 [Spironucleus salmonicida]